MSATRERIEKAADRAGFTVTRRGIFDELVNGSTTIIIMYTAAGAVSGADLYTHGKLIERVSAPTPGRAAIVIEWMDPTPTRCRNGEHKPGCGHKPGYW